MKREVFSSRNSVNYPFFMVKVLSVNKSKKAQDLLPFGIIFGIYTALYNLPFIHPFTHTDGILQLP